jgi:hypothetical protein
MIVRRMAAVLCLAGCGSFDGAAVQKLTSLSPLDVNPGQYEVLVNLPEGLDIQPQGASLRIAAQRTDTRAVSEETYVLARADTSSGTSIYKIAPEDLPRLQAQQSLIREWESQGQSQGQFGFDVEGCTVDNGPDLDALMSVSVKDTADNSLIPVIQPTPIRNIMLTGGNNQLILPPC